MQVTHQRPCILCIGGLDPSGGAGLQADIEAIAQCGGHALPIASCLTVQNTSKAILANVVDTNIIQQQVDALLVDLQIAAFKIGVIPSQEIAIKVAEIITQLPKIPIVLDPVLEASHGIEFVNQETLDSIRDNVLPKTTVVTPNVKELNQLVTGDECITSKARSLCQLGPEHVLVTGTEENSKNIVHYLVNSENVLSEYHCPRLKHEFHGSGCTLSSAISCFLALDMDINKAVKHAQNYTMQSLENADTPGLGQWMPNRTLDKQ